MTNTLYGFNAMEVQEAFVKIREQVGSQQTPDTLFNSVIALELLSPTLLEKFYCTCTSIGDFASPLQPFVLCS